MTELDVSDWVPYPLPEVLAFFSDPRNLPRIMPAELERTSFRIFVFSSTTTGY